MSDLNQVTMIGRLTRDPELRMVGSSNISVCNFSIANNKTYIKDGQKVDDVSFFNAVAWGRIGEIINQYCRKGHRIGLTGRLSQSSYDDKDGRKVSKVEIVVAQMQLLEPRSDNQSGQNTYGGHQHDQQPQNAQQSQNISQPQQGHQQDNFNNDDIPF